MCREATLYRFNPKTLDSSLTLENIHGIVKYCSDWLFWQYREIGQRYFNNHPGIPRKHSLSFLNFVFPCLPSTPPTHRHRYHHPYNHRNYSLTRHDPHQLYYLCAACLFSCVADQFVGAVTEWAWIWDDTGADPDVPGSVWRVKMLKSMIVADWGNHTYYGGWLRPSYSLWWPTGTLASSLSYCHRSLVQSYRTLWFELRILAISVYPIKTSIFLMNVNLKYFPIDWPNL